MFSQLLVKLDTDLIKNKLRKKKKSQNMPPMFHFESKEMSTDAKLMADKQSHFRF